MTDEELIARLREIQGQAGLFASAAAERIETLRADRDEHAEALKVNNAVLCEALLRVVAAEAVAEKLRAERDEHRRNWERAFNANTALEDQIATLTARVEELTFPDDWRDRAHSFKGAFKLQQAWADGFNAARAALSATTEE